jgi:hypothetical protein
MTATGIARKGQRKCTTNMHLQHEDDRIYVEVGKNHIQEPPNCETPYHTQLQQVHTIMTSYALRFLMKKVQYFTFT